MDELNIRKNTRVLYKNSVFLVLNGKEYSGCKTDNLSMKGVFLPELTGPLAGETGTLRLELDRKSKAVIRAEVRVVRVDNSGVGLEFTAVDTNSFFYLKRVVMYNSGDPDSFIDELN